MQFKQCSEAIYEALKDFLTPICFEFVLRCWVFHTGKRAPQVLVSFQ